ncbi:MAG: helix-turn-helix domain-containing protein [Oscillospiraceae bacterium]|nr:helix-turn-helix domain-containing protein [Oscillospiraceae bacterium]
MSAKTPKQSPNTNNTFGRLLSSYLEKRRKTQEMLADETGLSRSTIGRMIVNKDHRGGNYRTTEEAVIKICFALELGEKESKELYDAAFPERRIWWECIANRDSIEETDTKLKDAGLPQLFNAAREEKHR